MSQDLAAATSATNRTQQQMRLQRTHPRIMESGDGSLRKDTSEEGGDVGRVRSEENDAEPAPDVDEKFVGPGLGCFEGHQVTEK